MDDMLAAGLLEELRDFHRRYNREKVAENRWVMSQLPLCSQSHLPDRCKARHDSLQQLRCVAAHSSSLAVPAPSAGPADGIGSIFP